MSDEEPKVMTKADLARRLGVTHGQVSHWVAAGLPVREDGRLDTDAAFAWVRRTLSARSKAARALAAGTSPPAPAHRSTSPDPEGDELRRIQVRRAQLGLERDEEERLRRAGTLVSASEAKLAWTRELSELLARQERLLLGELVDALAARFGLDKATVKTVVKAIWRAWRSGEAADAAERAAAQPELVSMVPERPVPGAEPREDGGAAA